MAVDVNEQLNAGSGIIIQQGLMNNQRVSHYIDYAFSKDLFQGGQGETALNLAALNSADRTPVIKSVN